MKVVLVLLGLFLSFNVKAESDYQLYFYTELDVNNIHTDTLLIDTKKLPNIIKREERIELCVTEYIRKHSKSYTAIAKQNLYEMMHDFDRITSRIYGKKPAQDIVPLEEKIEAVAKVQCEVYNAMGILK